MSALATVEASDELRVALERPDPSGAEQLVAQFGDRAYRLAIRITGNPRMPRRQEWREVRTC